MNYVEETGRKKNGLGRDRKLPRRWPRLSKDKVRLAFLKTDFNKWVDEDEQDGAAPVNDIDDDGLGGMGGMGGMGGAGGFPGGAPGGFPSGAAGGADADGPSVEEGD